MGSIAELEDKLAIHELIARYNFALNFGDIEGWVGCFTEDGIFECPFAIFKGHPALRQYITERTAERQKYPLRHLPTNIIVEVRGDRASAQFYLLTLQVRPEGMQLLTTGVYHDQIKKIDGTWRFSHRKVQLDNTSWANQVFPASYLEKSFLSAKR